MPKVFQVFSNLNIGIATLSLYFIFINDSVFIHKSLLAIILFLGLLKTFSKERFELQNIEKKIIYLFIFYSLSFLIYIFVDEKFSLRNLDHPSRFFIFIPAIFLFRELKLSRYLSLILLFAASISSIFVISNYLILNVYRGYTFSCISGAQHSSIYCFFTFYIFLNSANRFIKSFAFLSCILSFTAVIFSETRGVILCIPIIFILTFLLSRGRNLWKYFLSSSIALFSLLAALFMTVSSLQDRFYSTISSIDDKLIQIVENNKSDVESISARIDFIYYGLKAFTKEPLLGHGRNGFVQAMIDNGMSKSVSLVATHSHNQFISDLVMRGIFGFLCTLVFMLLLLLFFLSTRKKGEYSFSSLGIIFITSYLCFFMTDSPFIGSMHSLRFFIIMLFVLIYASLDNLPKKECP